MIILITSSLFIAGAYWITFMNSPRYANILLGVVALSFVIGQIEAIQLYSLLGIVAGFVVMIKSQPVRKKAIQAWFAQQGFRPVQVADTRALFSDNTSLGTMSYATYQTETAGIPFILAIRCHAYRSGNTPSIVFHSSFYFQDKVDVDQLAQAFTAKKEQTPHSNFFTSQFRYFDLKACDIFRPASGGVVVSWRVPDTVSGYNDRYEWVKQALHSSPL